MRINYNISAARAANALNRTDKALEQSLNRLSSGLKINKAKDNPAGIAMANRMKVQLRGLDKAGDNTGDGISVVQIADGALSEIESMIDRMTQLAVQSANGTMSANERKYCQDEMKQLQTEITRIADTTEFNGQKLLGGQFESKAYTTNADVQVSRVGDYVHVGGDYPLRGVNLAFDPVTGCLDTSLDANGKVKGFTATLPLGGDFPPDCEWEIKENEVVLKGSQGFELWLDFNYVTDRTKPIAEAAYAAVLKDRQDAADQYNQANPGADKVAEDFITQFPYPPSPGVPSFTAYEPVQDFDIDITGIGAMRLQVGSNEGHIIEVKIPKVSLRNMGIETLNLATEDTATVALTKLNDALTYISDVRSRLGAYQNRMESSLNNLETNEENLTGAYSRLMDTDMAEEMTEYTNQQVISQAGTSMLAQANERPSMLLQLLQ